jgi:hypothetical protein
MTDLGVERGNFRKGLIGMCGATDLYFRSHIPLKSEF